MKILHQTQSGLSKALKALLLGLVLAAGPLDIRAEILKTGNEVFQTLDGRGKIVISRDEPGIFIAVGAPIDIQMFDPEQLRSDSTQHVFIRFDSTLGNYSKLVFGNKRSYRIVGSLTFEIGSFRVALDNANGFISIAETAGAEDALGILGIRGLETVARFKGTTAVALLEANQLTPYRGIVKTFAFNGSELTLSGQPVTNSAIGLTLDPPSNACVDRRDKVYLAPKELVQIRDLAASTQRVETLDKILRQQKTAHPLDSLILLKVTDTMVTALDYENGKIKTIRPHTSAPDNQVCVIEDLGL